MKDLLASRECCSGRTQRTVSEMKDLLASRGGCCSGRTQRTVSEMKDLLASRGGGAVVGGLSAPLAGWRVRQIGRGLWSRTTQRTVSGERYQDLSLKWAASGGNFNMELSERKLGAVRVEEASKAEHSPGGFGCFGWILTILSFIFIFATFPLSIWFCLKVVKEYERAVIFRLGRIVHGGAKGPGIFWTIPCTDSFSLVDLRTVSFSVPPQEVLTKDSVTIMVDAIVYYRVFDPVMSVISVINVANVTHLLAQTTLRNMLGTKTLTSILTERENMAQEMEKFLFDVSKQWGIKVERVEIKNVCLPVALQRAMAAEAEAVRDAKAKVIAAEGEMNASRALKEAAMVMASSPNALQLRYLQTLSEVATERSSTILFPVPINIMPMFRKK
ncbi:stomatin-like isoform X2 [Carcharodon carcharias]|uniref:stomatin-like isoform X2 n=1 Tax=Carcharodon carcharias TaxID=13397 RepID=UPI001B7F5156|nr:stomatin-like isoform X2 [Carcharodon carcharias]